MLTEELFTKEESTFQISPEAIEVDEKNKTLNHFNSFAILDPLGNIQQQGKGVQGIYHDGTRFINRCRLLINDKKPVLLSSRVKEDNEILSTDLTNPSLRECNLDENSIHIHRSQFVRDGVFYEELTIKQFINCECSIGLSLSFGSDFKDLFEIRGIKRNVTLNPVKYSHTSHGLRMSYVGQDNITRRALIDVSSDADFEFRKTTAYFNLELKPGSEVKIDLKISCRVNDKTEASDTYKQARQSIAKEIKETRELFAEVYTSNTQFNHWVHRSRADIMSLLTQTPYGNYPYAGVPWYNTAFGRDGIITAMEILWLAPSVGRDVLNFLAKKQATEDIPEKDAEPGKILHEMRNGEMANTGEVPFSEYYGTIDATPLFVMLAGMYYQRTNDTDTIKKLWPNLLAALKWIDEYGDLDGDGYVEYKHKAHNGLTNQGWKDSFDSVMYENGDLAEPPIALCEVQAYVYGAKQHASVLASVMGEEKKSAKLAEEAADLKKRFNKDFWDDDRKCFVIALDGKKKKCRVISSNAGHCLFTGIADEDKAELVVKALMSSQMFTGWGIRTLHQAEKRYNPMSYHNGSIWPHDNALIAYGMARYGYQVETMKVLQSMFDTALMFEQQRLPELFCGFERRIGEGPTAYPVACSPQAWSVTVVYMLLQALLGVEINAQEKTITFNNPAMPRYLERISVEKLHTAEGEFVFEFNKMENDVSLHLREKPAGWQVIMKK